MEKMSRGQQQELTAAMVRAVPTNLDSDTAQRWIVGEGQTALQGMLDRMLREGPPASADPDAWVDEFDLAKVERREFNVAIDPTQTVEQMVVAGGYDYVNPNHTTAIFSFHRAVTGEKPIVKKVMAFRIGRNATIAQAKRLRTRLGLGSIGVDHELAVGAQHQSAQRELGWIVNPDSVVVVGGMRCVSCLFGGAGLRGLSLSDTGHGWYGNAWFFGLASE